MDILLASPIDSSAIESLRRSHSVEFAFSAPPDTLSSLLRDTEVLIFRSGVDISADVLGSADRLRFVVRAGSGLDNVDLDYLRSRRIRLVRIPGPGAQAVAELTFALMLSLARNVCLADRGIREGRWPKHELGGPLTARKTMGIIGVGNIGTRVGELASRWGMRVIGCVEHPSPARAAAFLKRGIILTDCEAVTAEADFLTLHVPLKDSTYRLIADTSLSRMKEGSFLINASRGGVVDERALYRALTQGRLRGAALDVHEQEGQGTIPALAALPNVVLTPHIGAMALDSQQEIGRRVVRLIESFVEGRIEEEAQDGELVT
jgi:D-3-phosphoglycerate dehydrogenase / 2-oxoglutarate reductase